MIYYIFTGEVEVVYERKATPEQIQRARALQLPDSFYLYEDAPGCSGCIGCEKDSKKEQVRWKFIVTMKECQRLNC